MTRGATGELSSGAAVFGFDPEDRAARTPEVEDLFGRAVATVQIGNTGTQFLIRRNRFIAASMPDWDAGANLVPFEVLDRSAEGLRLRRGAHVPSAVPDNVTLDTSAFFNSLGTGVFYLSTDASSNQLILNFSPVPVPEPGLAVLVGAAALAVVRRRR